MNFKGEKDCLTYATNTGEVICHELNAPFNKTKFKISHATSVTDFDINDSNDLMVAASQDYLALFSLTGQELRRISPAEGHVRACRFLPQNSNLVICALSNGVLQVLNVSTGKFNQTSSNMLGQTLAVTMNATGSVFWAGNDRHCIESFRIDSSMGKLQKGCRAHTNKT